MLELVVLHGGADIICIRGVFGMEHVRAKIKDCLLVVALLVAFADLLHAEVLYEHGDSVDEVAFFDRLRESFLGQVAQADEAVNEDRRWHLLFWNVLLVDQLKERVHGFRCHVGILLKHLEGSRGVQDVGEQS